MNVRQCKSKLKVLSESKRVYQMLPKKDEVCQTLQEKVEGTFIFCKRNVKVCQLLPEETKKIVGCCQIKLKICQVLKEKLEGMSDSALESRM
jgi:hypothetical protein